MREHNLLNAAFHAWLHGPQDDQELLADAFNAWSYKEREQDKHALNTTEVCEQLGSTEKYVPHWNSRKNLNAQLRRSNVLYHQDLNPDVVRHEERSRNSGCEAFWNASFQN